MFKKLAAAMGAGGAKVDTILDSAGVQPGGTLTGRVEVKGGEVEQTIQGIRAALSAVVEVEGTNSQGDDTEHKAKRRVGETRVSGPITVQPGELQTLPFQLVVPPELPPNVIGGRNMSGIKLEVETVLEIEKARDAKDHDPVDVHALPAQNAVFQAMEQLGFTFKSADLEERLPRKRGRGHVRHAPGRSRRAARGRQEGLHVRGLRQEALVPALALRHGRARRRQPPEGDPRRGLSFTAGTAGNGTLPAGVG